MHCRQLSLPSSHPLCFDSASRTQSQVVALTAGLFLTCSARITNISSGENTLLSRKSGAPAGRFPDMDQKPLAGSRWGIKGTTNCPSGSRENDNPSVVGLGSEPTKWNVRTGRLRDVSRRANKGKGSSDTKGPLPLSGRSVSLHECLPVWQHPRQLRQQVSFQL